MHASKNGNLITNCYFKIPLKYNLKIYKINDGKWIARLVYEQFHWYRYIQPWQFYSIIMQILTLLRLSSLTYIPTSKLNASKFLTTKR